MPQEINLVCMSGQGSVQTVQLMARAFFVQHGKYVYSQVSPGARAKSSPVVSMLKVDDKPITAISMNYHPTELIVFWDGLLNVAAHQGHPIVTDAIGRIRSGSIIVNTKLEPEEVHIPYDFAGTVAAVDADGLMEKHLGRKPAPVGTALMGAYAAVTGALDLDLLLELIDEKFSGSVAVKNKLATREAFETVRIARKIRVANGRTVTDPAPADIDAMLEWIPLNRAKPMVGASRGDPSIWRETIPVCEDTKCACKGMCVSEVLCPDNTGFIVRKGIEAGQGYRVDTDYCRGCGICVDVCVYGALRMVPERELLKTNPAYEGITVAPHRPGKAS